MICHSDRFLPLLNEVVVGFFPEELFSVVGGFFPSKESERGKDKRMLCNVVAELTAENQIDEHLFDFLVEFESRES